MSGKKNLKPAAFQFTVRPLSKAEGGGYLVEYPDIPGCMSDGETIEEAIANGREALRDCIAVFQESGRKVPKPCIEAAQWRQSLPRTLYSKLTKQAAYEGVGTNSLVTAISAEAIGSKLNRLEKPRREVCGQGIWETSPV